MLLDHVAIEEIAIEASYGALQDISLPVLLCRDREAAGFEHYLDNPAAYVELKQMRARIVEIVAEEFRWIERDRAARETGVQRIRESSADVVEFRGSGPAQSVKPGRLPDGATIFGRDPIKALSQTFQTIRPFLPPTGG